MNEFEKMIWKLPVEVVLATKETRQNPKYHPEIFLYNHIEKVWNKAKQANAGHDMILISLFHDLGKIDTTFRKTRKDGTEAWVSYGHEFASWKYLDLYLNRYDYDEKEMIYWICANHMRIHQYNSGELKNKIKRKELEEHKWFEQLKMFAEFDKGGKTNA